jgi:hypothetical protein
MHALEPLRRFHFVRHPQRQPVMSRQPESAIEGFAHLRATLVTHRPGGE